MERRLRGVARATRQNRGGRKHYANWVRSGWRPARERDRRRAGRRASPAVALWRLLSLGLATPTRDLLDEVDALAEGIEERPAAPTGLAALREAIARSSPEAIATSQARLFGGKVAVAPYEGSYEDDPFRQARQMSDVAGFYRAFGAEAHGPAYERPDHAGCELEFLAFLGARRLAAVDAGASRRGRPLPGGRGGVPARARGPLAAGVLPGARARRHRIPSMRRSAALGADGVEAELARRGIEPEPLGPRARRLSVEADELECAAGAEPVTPLLPGSRRRRRDTLTASCTRATARQASALRRRRQLRLGLLVLGQPALQHAARQHADQPAVLDDGHALGVLLLEEAEGLVERRVGVDRRVRLLRDRAEARSCAGRGRLRRRGRRASCG